MDAEVNVDLASFGFALANVSSELKKNRAIFTTSNIGPQRAMIATDAVIIELLIKSKYKCLIFDS